MSQSPKDTQPEKASSFRVPSFKNLFRKDSKKIDGPSSTARTRSITSQDVNNGSFRMSDVDFEALNVRPSLEMDESRFKLLNIIPESYEGYLWRKGSVTSMWRNDPDYFQIKGTVLLQFRQKPKLKLFSNENIFSLHRTVELKNCSVEPMGIRNHHAFKIIFLLQGDTKELVLDANSDHHREAWMQSINEAAFSLEVTDFRPAAKIGEGEWGNVFVVRKRDGLRESDNKLYAVKEIEMSRTSNVKHIIHERHVLGSVSLHPFVIGLHYCFRYGRYLYFVMDFAAGGDLFTRMKRSKPTRSEAVLYAAEVLLALEHLHHHSVVYRDLKPENVLLDADGHVQLADMGLAKVLKEGERTLTFCGTESYIAPEIIHRTPYGYSVDFWQFGCFVFELYCGRSPFWRPRHLRQNLHETIVSGVYKVPSSVPTEARPIIAQLLNTTISKRLGCGPTQWAEVKGDSYFQNIDFVALMNNAALPSKDDDSLNSGSLRKYMSNFDSCFTSAPPEFKSSKKKKSSATSALFHDELLGFDLFEMKCYNQTQT
mmetsp:Transcript_11449/g.14918  ORF Transcript_11449/g.14918 Transcript_11449/m.14918 type:complete len:540 (-) Transcript_11449:468-2087(-)